MIKIIFVGANNPETGRMMRALSSQGEQEFVGFIDNDEAKRGTSFLGLPVFGGFGALADFNLAEFHFVNLITGSTTVRYETSRALAAMGCRFANFVHPSVSLDDVSLGTGNYIQEAVILQAGVHVEDNSSIHMGTLVGHESRIGNSVFIAHGCSISGLVEIGDGTFMGTHATVLPRVKIGNWVTVGGGSVIIKDVPDYAVVVGNPGRIIRHSEVKYTDGTI